MTGSEIMERAIKYQKERQGVRVKIRIPSALWEQIQMCANQCGQSPEDYVECVCHAVKVGKLCVPNGVFCEVGTREASATVWVRVPHGFDTSAGNIRPILKTAVARTIAAMPPMPERLPVEGVDYLVEGRIYTRLTAKGVI